VIAGAVASVYQADRVRAITDRLGIELFTPLWHMDTVVLLREVAERMEAIIIVTAAEGLDEQFLGARFDDDLIRSILPGKEGNTSPLRSMHRFTPGRSPIPAVRSGHLPAAMKWSSGVLADGPKQ